MVLRCAGMRGAEAAAEGQPRCRGGAARAWVEGSSSSFGAVRRRARPAAAGWTAGPCVSGCACRSSWFSHLVLWGPQLRPTWSFGRGVPGVFLPSLRTCRVQPKPFIQQR